MKKIELLAPAGDIIRAKFALLYGADAIYLGGPMLGLRANAINFTYDEIKEITSFAHQLNKKVYVTVNIVLHNTELKVVKQYLKKLEEYKIDAIIVSDPYIIEIAKKTTKLEVHLSTQASTMNYKAIKFYEKLGVKRIVLARECTKEDIFLIRENTNIELECFIHGAMCSAISGRCVLSNYFTNRDANRGGCAQICRWDFNLENEEKKQLKGEVPFTFCAKDLSMLKYIPDMINLDITSFKIEGRMRSIYYIATVVSIYRKVIDEYMKNPKDYKYNINYEKMLRRCANRDSVPQFFGGENDLNISYYNGREEISNQDFLGVVLEYDKNTKYATVEQRNYFKIGDTVEIFGPNHEEYIFVIDDIIDLDGNKKKIVNHPLEVVKIKFDKQVEKYDLMRIKFDK